MVGQALLLSHLYPCTSFAFQHELGRKTTIARGYSGKLSSCSIGETNDKLHSSTESSEIDVCLTTNSAVLLVGITLLAKHVGLNHLLPPTSFRRGFDEVSLPR